MAAGRKPCLASIGIRGVTCLVQPRLLETKSAGGRQHALLSCVCSLLARKATRMRDTSSTASRATRTPEPTWEIAYLFPNQGHWSEEEYLALDGNQLVEFSRGFLEVLPVP